MSTRELGQVRETLTAAGMDISYAYEDLVFLEHNGFLLQFSDHPQHVLIHVNAEADTGGLNAALTLLQEKAAASDLVFNRGGRYRLHEADEGNIQIEFL